MPGATTGEKTALGRPGNRVPDDSVTGPPSILTYRNFSIDYARREVTIARQRIRVTAKEFDLLWTLASQPGRVFRRPELLRLVWGQHIHVDQRTVDAHVVKLRRKLRRAAAGMWHIETVWGIGYRLTGDSSEDLRP